MMKKRSLTKRMLVPGGAAVCLLTSLCYPTSLSTWTTTVHAHHESTEEAQTSSYDLQRLHQLTMECLAVNKKLERANQKDSQAPLSRLREIATERQELLTSLIRENPTLMLQVVLPDHILATLPNKLQSYFEQEVTLDG